jgi:hypothetical protein
MDSKAKMKVSDEKKIPNDGESKDETPVDSRSHKKKEGDPRT